jgi:DNA-binding transcriptional LysR family regulator
MLAGMAWFNHHHLLYFWTVAREGSIARACGQLHLTQPTISAQLRSLEKALGARLFDRVGRNLVLTETGRVVYRYADEIFTLGRELQDTLYIRDHQGQQGDSHRDAEVLAGRRIAARTQAALQGPLLQPLHRMAPPFASKADR